MGNDFKKRIEDALSENKLAMKKVSLEAGMSETYLRDVLKRGRTPSVDNLRKIESAIARLAGSNLSLTDNDARMIPTSLISVTGIVSAGVFRESTFVYNGKTDKVPSMPRDSIPLHAQYALEVQDQETSGQIDSGEFAICVLINEFSGDIPKDVLVHVERERSGLLESTLKLCETPLNGPVLFNPDKTEFKAQAGEKVTIRGLVVGKWASFV